MMRNTYGNAIGIFLSNSLGFSLAFLKWMFVFEFGTHLVLNLSLLFCDECCVEIWVLGCRRGELIR